MKPHRMHNPVHEEGRPGHVAALLKKGHEHVEKEHKGNEGEDEPNPLQNTSHQERVKPRRGAYTAEQHRQPFAQEPVYEAVNPVNQRGTAVKGDLEHEIHEGEEYGQSQDPVEEYFIKKLSNLKAPLHRPLQNLLEEAVDVSVPLLGQDGLYVVSVVALQPLPGLFYPVRQGYIRLLPELLQEETVVLQNLYGTPPEGIGASRLKKEPLYIPQLLLHHPAEPHLGGNKPLLNSLKGGIQNPLNPQPLCGGGGDTGNTQQPLKHTQIQLIPLALELIPHVQHNHHGLTQVRKLGGEVEVPLKVGGVQNVYYQMRVLIQQELLGYALLKGVGGEAVDTRKVHKTEPHSPVLK